MNKTKGKIFGYLGVWHRVSDPAFFKSLVALGWIQKKDCVEATTMSGAPTRAEAAGLYIWPDNV